jgi:hypothetical protein
MTLDLLLLRLFTEVSAIDLMICCFLTITEQNAKVL